MTNEQATAPPEPLTPDYFQRQPEASPPDSGAQSQPKAQPEPEPKANQQKPKPKPPRKGKTQRKQKRIIGPETEREALLAEIDRLQSKRDVKTLDLQLRIITLRKFLESHDLWQPFLAKTIWW